MGEKKPYHIPSILTKLVKADYHGCILRVADSKMASNIGIQGICAKETEHTFQLVTLEQGVKKIIKKGNVFAFIYDGIEFKIYGNQFQIRPHDRVSKKFKGCNSIKL